MTLSYTPATKKGAIHKITIDGESLETTLSKEVLNFANPRIFDKSVWKELKEAVRLGNKLTVDGGGVFGDADRIL